MYHSKKPNEYFEKLSKGEIPNHSSIYKFGRNSAIGATESIVSVGGIYGLPTSAETLTVTSDDIDDAYPSGTGARVVNIEGLDENWEYVTEDINLGATSINTYLRVFRVRVIEAGIITPINGGNIGTITITQSSSAIQMIKVSPYAGQTLTSCYTVPSGYKAILWDADISLGAGKQAVSYLKARDNKIVNSPFMIKAVRDNYQNAFVKDFKIGREYTEKTDIMFTSISESAGTAVSATFLLELIKIV